jgi:hypothetical protein
MEDVSQSAGPVFAHRTYPGRIGTIMGGGAILYPGYVIIGTIEIIAACIEATWSAAFRPEDKGHRHCGCYQRCHGRRPSRSDGSTGVRDGKTSVRCGSTGVRYGVTGVSGAWIGGSPI